MVDNLTTLRSSEFLCGHIDSLFLDIDFIRKIEDGYFETKEHIVYRITDQSLKIEITILKETNTVNMIMLEEKSSSSKNRSVNIVDDIGIFEKTNVSIKADNVDVYFDEDSNLCDSIYMKF